MPRGQAFGYVPPPVEQGSTTKPFASRTYATVRPYGIRRGPLTSTHPAATARAAAATRAVPWLRSVKA